MTVITHAQSQGGPPSSLPGPADANLIDQAIAAISQVYPDKGSKLTNLRSGNHIRVFQQPAEEEREDDIRGYARGANIYIDTGDGQLVPGIAATLLHELMHVENAVSSGTAKDPTCDPGEPADEPKGDGAAARNHGDIHRQSAEALCEMSCAGIFSAVGCEEIKERLRSAVLLYESSSMTAVEIADLIPLSFLEECCCIEGWTPL